MTLLVDILLISASQQKGQQTTAVDVYLVNPAAWSKEKGRTMALMAAVKLFKVGVATTHGRVLVLQVEKPTVAGFDQLADSKDKAFVKKAETTKTMIHEAHCLEDKVLELDSDSQVRIASETVGKTLIHLKQDK
jgi:hypothetical protein